MKCRVCECTENNACMGGCEWAEPDLCSSCAQIILLLCEYYDTAGPGPIKSADRGAALFERAGKEAVKLIATEQNESAADGPLVLITGVR